MGIQGAAIASVIAEAVSILFFVVYTRLTVDIRKYALNQIRSFDFGLLKRVLDISVFTMLQYFCLSLLGLYSLSLWSIWGNGSWRWRISYVVFTS